MRAVVRPRLNRDGTLDLDVDGEVSGAGAKGPLKTHVRVDAGRALELARIGEGRRQVRVWVRATVEPEPAAPR